MSREKIMNNKELAKFLDITEQGLYKWKKSRPNLYKIVMEWKEGNKKQNNNDQYEIPVINIKAAAGSSGNILTTIDDFQTDKKIHVDKILFKEKPNQNIKAIQVDGYSMTPMLYPDSWVLFYETNEYTGDGLYIINWQNILMVKLLQIDFANNKLLIKSANKDYEDWEVNQDNQEYFSIVGKVMRCII